MRIRRIEVRNFRKLVGPVVIDQLRDGLTVIAGDNEDGKSTLLHALRAALFLKHKSSVTDELLPFGSKVRPELRLDLELGGKPYSLFKAFCQNPRAELVTPTGKLEGLAAEEELSRLLRFDTPQKANADPKSEHQGLCGLLWVTQGESFRNHQSASSLQRDLQSALEAEVGSVLTGEIGRKLLDVFRERYEQNFGKAGRPREELRKAGEKVEQLASKLSELRRRLSEYESKVDLLGELRDKLRRYSEAGTLETLKAELLRDESALLSLHQREQALLAVRQDLALSLQRLDGERARQKRRRDGREKLRVSEEELLRREVRIQASGIGLVAEEELWRAAETRRKQKSDEKKSVEAEVAALVRRVERRRLGAEHEELLARLAEAEALQARCSALSDALLKLPIDDKQLAALQKQAAVVRDREVELQAVATLLELALVGPGPLVIDGQLIDGRAATRLLTERTELELPGQLKLVISPGRTGAARLREALSQEQDKLELLLQKAGVGDLTAAEQEAVSRKALLDEEKDLAQRLSRLCPKGLATLREEAVRLGRQLAQLGEDIEPSLPLEAIQRQLGERQQSLDALCRELVLLEEDVERKRLTVEKLRTEQASLDGMLTQQRREVERDRAQLAQEAADVSDAQLDAAVYKQEQDAETKQNQAKTIEDELKTSDIDGIRLSVTQRRDAVDELGRQLLGLEQKAQELQIELRTLGQQALDEEVAETAATYERAKVELSHRQRQAEAIRLLYESMQTHDQRSREAYLLPLLRLCEPYLQAILPGCRLGLDETTLEIKGLWRGEILEPFSSLSLGTREQLAVVVRLAVADLMAQRGQSVPLVLDDALTFCDDARFDRMLRLLRRGASRHQILLLTCHEREFVRSGAKLIRLADCKAA